MGDDDDVDVLGLDARGGEVGEKLTDGAVGDGRLPVSSSTSLDPVLISVGLNGAVTPPARPAIVGSPADPVAGQTLPDREPKTSTWLRYRVVRRVACNRT